MRHCAFVLRLSENRVILTTVALSQYHRLTGDKTDDIIMTWLCNAIATVMRFIVVVTAMDLRFGGFIVGGLCVYKAMTDDCSTGANRLTVVIMIRLVTELIKHARTITDLSLNRVTRACIAVARVDILPTQEATPALRVIDTTALIHSHAARW